MIAAVILAAGNATRFGAPKVIAPLRGIELVRHVIDRLTLAGIAEIVVVAGEHLAAIETSASGSIATVVRNPAPSAGMSSSLVTAMHALSPECLAFVVALGDQPEIDPALVRRLIAVWEGCNAAAVVPVFQGGVRGHPVLFDISMRPFLLELTGDQGARALLEAMSDRVVLVHVDAPPPLDVDTPEDLALLGR